MFGDLSWPALILLAVDWLLRLGLTLHLVMRRRPLSVTLTWATIVLVTPVLGGVFYLVFGQVRVGADRALWKRRFTNEFFHDALEFYGARGVLDAPREFRSLAAYGSHAGGLPPVMGNAVRVLTGPEAFLGALAEDIGRASKRVCIQTYIWQDAPGTRALLDALADAASRGVSVRLLLDSLGSRSFLRSGECARLRAAGVRVVGTLPVALWRILIRRLDVRNHRKIAVIDGRLAYCGSHNITDSTFGAAGHDPIGPWIDASVRIEGPLASELELVFLRDWEFDADEPIERIEPYLQDVAPVPGGVIAQALASGPGVAPRVFEQALLAALYGARADIRLCAPYFVPDDATLSALVSAARRGVRVELIVPARSDSLLAAAAGRSTFDELLSAGVRVFAHGPGLLHAKLIIVDDTLVGTGSANLDMRSFHINYEVTVLVYDPGVAAAHERLFDAWRAQSREVVPETWAGRGVMQRLGHNLAYLAGQVL